MASAIATENPDPAHRPRPRKWRQLLKGLRLAPGSKLGRAIFVLNLLGLTILIAGALILNELRRGLIEARIDSLTTQGEFIVKVLDQTATVGEPLPALKAAEASDFLQLLFIPRSQRARLFDAEGNLLADSYIVADRVEWKVLPPARRPGERFALTLQDADAKPRAVEKARTALRTEIDKAMRGEAVSGVRIAENGDRVVSVSMPIQHVQAVLGVLTLEAGDVDEIVAKERAALLPFILIAVGVTSLSSLLLHQLIARPVTRLARAADRVRLHGERAIALPDVARRDDEIGDLTRALQDMTLTQSERIDAIERFAADVAHEIKNPLTSIRSAVETLDLVKDDKSRRRLLDILKQDVGRMDRLVTDISNASRLDAELSRDAPHPLDLHRLLSDVASLYEAQVGTEPSSKKVHVRFKDFDGLEPPLVIGRETPLSQVFRNLIDNARSFSAPEGEVRIGLRRERGRVMVTVEDDGPGIPPENLETVFERFYTSRPKGSAFGGNSGLGLSIARQIIEAHNGVIRAENRLDSDGAVLGARFIVVLPPARG
ncbi:MAG: histidine kinase [Caulobacterales bacterium 68-7]|nr:sensor N-terminal transmembrane domain-containing protein [Caulobacterales bacterium]OJU13163.1 MAG: histidine kinase [Caulobacterales bacterium 68-7]